MVKNPLYIDQRWCLKNFKFGVNCYGVKPEGEVVCQRPTDDGRDNPICRENPKACNILTNDSISSFNSKLWSIWDSPKKGC